MSYDATAISSVGLRHHPSAYAPWIKRVGASLVDSALTAIAMTPIWIGYVIVLSSVLGNGAVDPVTGETTVDSAAASGGLIGAVLMLIGVLCYLAFFLWNICIKQGRTGYTVGKSAVGIRLVSEQTGAPIGVGNSFLRQLAHLLDSLSLYVGYLWPLWDQKRQTFADKVMSTVVIEAPQPR
jgi:uncharacterized RDD family membrane protein YckC